MNKEKTDKRPARLSAKGKIICGAGLILVLLIVISVLLVKIFGSKEKNIISEILPAKLEITVQPADCTVTPGEQYEFTVEAEGSGLTYQWQYSEDGETWEDSTSLSAKTEIYSGMALKNYFGRYYRCAVSDSKGDYLTSEPARLYVAGIMAKVNAEVKAKGIFLKWPELEYVPKWGVLRREKGQTKYEEIAFTDQETKADEEKASADQETEADEEIESADHVTYLDKDVESGHTYEYLVYGTDEEETSFASYASGAPAEMLYIAPVEISALIALEGGIGVHWEAVPGAEYYRISRKDGESGTWNDLAVTTETAFGDISVRAGETYYYRVTPVNEDDTKELAATGEEKELLYLRPVGENKYVKAARIFLHVEADTDSEYKVLIYKDPVYVADVAKETDKGRWLRVTTDDVNYYYVWEPNGKNYFSDSTTQIDYHSDNPVIQELLDEAVTWLDKKTMYKHKDSTGIANADGYYCFDCSGFVTYVLDKVMTKRVPTYHVPAKVAKMINLRSAYNQDYPGEYVIKDISPSEMRPGDILFFKTIDEGEGGQSDTIANHCGLYLGNGEFIHCTKYNWGGNGVYLMPLEGHYDKKLVAVRRFVPWTIEPANVTLYAAKSTVEVYNSMEDNKAVVAQLSQDTPVRLLYSGDEQFMYVEYGSGNKGFVYSDKMKNEVSSETRTVAQISLRLHGDCTTSSDYVSVYMGEEVTYMGYETASFAKVRYKGVVYYLYVGDENLDSYLTKNFQAMIERAQEKTLIASSNLRSSLSTASEDNIIGKLEEGSRVKVLATNSSGSMCFVVTEDGQRGFVSASRIG